MEKNYQLSMLREDMERAKITVAKHAAELLADEEVIPSFAHLEFNLTGLCNRTCSFCPRADPTVFGNVKEYISLDLYSKIMEDLRAINASPRIVYSGFGEPFTHKKLPEIVSITKHIRPQIKLEIKTDGDFLKPEKLIELFGRGLDHILVSVYDGPSDYAKFEKMREEAGLTPEQMMLRIRYWTPDHGYNLNLSNRAATVSGEFKEQLAIKEPLKRRCHYPFMMMMIDYNGDVLLCPHDWGKKRIVGNLKQQSVLEVWQSSGLHEVRLKLRAENRGYAPCNVCNVDGTLTGQKSFDQWNAYYNGKRLPNESTGERHSSS